MNRPTEAPQPTTAPESRETTFNAPPTKVDFKSTEEPLIIPFQIDWDDFDTGTLDE